MAKVLKAPPKEIKKTRISVRLPKKMLSELDDKLASDGFNKKQRSTWVSDAICRLSTKPLFNDYVLENWMDNGNNISTQFTLTQEACNKLEFIRETLTAEDLANTELKSAVVRTSIIHKFLDNDSN